MSRAFNFGAGPATLPLEVLEEAQQELVDFKGAGMSIMEMSHRGKEYMAVHEEAMANIRKLAGLDDAHEVLFLQGGASQQFAVVPMNLTIPGKKMGYINTGAWSKKAIKEAKLFGEVAIVADSTAAKPSAMPALADIKDGDYSFVHITSNETIEGTQFKVFPKTSSPLVADMSSDIFSRPLDFNSFGLIYAGAQKNLGPSGVTLVILRKDLAGRAQANVPAILKYATHLKDLSLYNTPPTYSIYILLLVTKWLLRQGGLAGIEKQNVAKAAKLYAAIDGSNGYYRGTASPAFRSDMNVTFRLPSEELEELFIKQASGQLMKGLKGHRDVGGVRASIYNALPPAGVDALVAFMKSFQQKNG